ncbi:MAG: hypothetical protein GXP55_04205 [Deltaproteobacteria bacterium]|nr:hypothetical protein [Deltaproteobacteria bacterium]
MTILRPDILASTSRLLVACGALSVLCIGCVPPSDGPDPDLGPIDETVSYADRINWPGIELGDHREIPFIRGFSTGRPSGYWFLGFVPRSTADAFWFCREGDTQCPLDEHHRLNWDHLVGHPLFMRIPGEPGFSPFWEMWTVRVPADFEPDSVKTIETLHSLELAGEVSVAPEITDFGTRFGVPVGPTETLLHCALVLQGTTVEDIGMMPDGSGPVLLPQVKFGWRAGYRVEFVDFSRSDGVFPTAADTESRPLMPFGNIYIMWRSCDSDPRPYICDLPGYATSDVRPVSEGGLGQDITGNRSTTDSNNTMGALSCELRSPTELPYSPLWKVSSVPIHAGVNIGLIDTYHDGAMSDIKSSEDIFAHVASGDFSTPEPQTEDEAGNPVPGNDGQIFFNCPAPLAIDSVPYPCE